MPKTLLLADDSRTIQQAVNMTFAGEDVKLITANDGEAALQVAKQSKPDLILADVAMPKLGGYELCQRVRGEAWPRRSEEHTSELQSRVDIVCRLLLEKK